MHLSKVYLWKGNVKLDSSHKSILLSPFTLYILNHLVDCEDSSESISRPLEMEASSSYNLESTMSEKQVGVCVCLCVRGFWLGMDH